MQVILDGLWANENGFFISSDKKLLDREMILNFMINESYWAMCRPMDVKAVYEDHGLQKPE